MEFILLLIVGSIIYGVVENYLKNNNTATPTDSCQPKNNSDNKDTKISLQPSEQIKFDDDMEFGKEKETHIVNNYYTQNNVYIQQNNYYKKSKSKDKTIPHTERIWEDMGYRVKNKNIYSHISGWGKIYTPDQVEKIGVKKQILQLESNLTKNQKKVKQLGHSLVNKYGSKRKAKDILVEEYDFNEDTAKFATGYRGYENY